MDYLVTARKWRPKIFADVVGQEHITETLQNAIKNNRIAHAYLFTGPRGVGKTTTARIYAKALNCESLKDAEPCNECTMCTEIQNLQSMDIIEIDGASNRGIDEIRTLRESVRYAPTRGKYKVYIIDEVHMLTKESFNAFLKTLEEPPDHTIFIFATTDIHKVPLTIISRCQRFDFRRIQMNTIKDTLSKIAKAEKINIDDKSLTIISKKADGSLRDAQSYFDQLVSFCGTDIESNTVSKMLNLIDDELYFNITNAILNNEFKSVFEVTNSIYENGWDFIDFLDGLIEHFRNVMTVLLTENTNLVETADEYKGMYLDYVDKFSKGDLLRVLNFLGKAQQELRFSQNQKLKTEIILAHLVALEKSSTMSEIISNLNSYTSEKKSEINTAEKKSVITKPEISTDPSLVHEESVHSQHYLSIEKSQVPKVSFQPGQDGQNVGPITEKWQRFINEISMEKGLTLAPALQSLNLESFSGNTLSVSSNYSDIEKTLEINQKYLEQKSELIFGKRLRLNFTPASVPDERNNSKSKTTKSSKKVSSDDPYEDIIINELGGKLIQQ